MSSDPRGIGGRVINACIGLLIGAMALYGAVSILRAIWLPLCIVVLIATISGLVVVTARRRYNRW